MHPGWTYTLLALCGALFVFGLWVDRSWGARHLPRVRRMAPVLQFGAVVAAYLLLRQGPGTDGPTAIRASMAARQPLLLDIYSDW